MNNIFVGNYKDNSEVQAVVDSIHALQKDLYTNDFYRVKKIVIDEKGQHKLEATLEIDWKAFDVMEKTLIGISWPAALAEANRQLSKASGAGNVSRAEYAAINGLIRAVEIKISKEAKRIKTKEVHEPKAEVDLQPLFQAKVRVTKDLGSYISAVLQENTNAQSQLNEPTGTLHDHTRYSKAAQVIRKEKIEVAQAKIEILGSLIDKVTHISEVQLKRFKEALRTARSEDVEVSERAMRIAYRLIKVETTQKKVGEKVKFGENFSEFRNALTDSETTFEKEIEEKEFLSTFTGLKCENPNNETIDYSRSRLALAWSVNKVKTFLFSEDVAPAAAGVKPDLKQEKN